jgi:crossover junction endodeoxyribonuclease RuvC
LNHPKIVILGIDPGLSITGYGVIEIVNNKAVSLGYGGIYNREKSKTIADKLENIYDGINRVIKTYQPAHCAIEEVFYHENVNTAIVMGHARGVVMLAAKQAGMAVFEYAAREVKMSTAGSGAASKQQVQAMVKNLLSLRELPRPQDAADALAVALCHFHRIKFRTIKNVL